MTWLLRLWFGPCWRRNHQLHPDPGDLVLYCVRCDKAWDLTEFTTPEEQR